jgi:hypothetical protein
VTGQQGEHVPLSFASVDVHPAPASPSQEQPGGTDPAGAPEGAREATGQRPLPLSGDPTRGAVDLDVSDVDLDTGDVEPEEEPPAQGVTPPNTPSRYGPSGTRIFGPDAVLKPVPTTVALQDVPIEHVPDIMADWVNVSFGDVRGVSARGHLHRHLGEIRQDSFAIGLLGSRLVIAVADGVGSCSLSQVGSAIAARRAATSEQLAATIDLVQLPSTGSLAGIADEISATAEQCGVPPRQLSSTLVAAVIDEIKTDQGSFTADITQLGDSTAWRLREGVWTELGVVRDPDALAAAPISNAVQPLPEYVTATTWRERLTTGDVLALMSDGVSSILMASEAFADSLADLWRVQAPPIAPLLEIIDATVKTYDDDRTFVAIRFGS